MANLAQLSQATHQPLGLTKEEYIRAERCLTGNSPVVGTIEGAQSVWDELHHTHIWQGNSVHYVGHFLPWHRYLVRTHEFLLQTLCGYRGAQPYRDELTDFDSAPLDESAMFDPVFGFGGDGAGGKRCTSGRERRKKLTDRRTLTHRGRCIQDGPFRDLTLHMTRRGNDANYCLSRSFNQTSFGWAKRANIEERYAIAEYTDVWECFNLYPHSAGHAAVGGVSLCFILLLLLFLSSPPSLSSLLTSQLPPSPRPFVLPSTMASSEDISDSASDNKKAAVPNAEKRDLTDLPQYDGDLVAEMSERERTIYEHGIQKFNRLGWKRLTVVLIVEAIALGSLSLPSTFATLGMVAGVICTVALGFFAIYTSYVVGQVKLKFPLVHHYPDAGRLMFGRFGYEVINVMLILQLLFLTGSHTLTGAIAWIDITQSDVCSVVFAVVSAIILLVLAVPPSFTEMAILGYVDFASIILAIGITIIATGVESTNAPGGLSAVNWSAWPKEDITFTDAFIAMTNIIFAYSFAMCQFSFMDEMHTPKDYVKSIWALGLTEMVIYTLTGAIVYAFVGKDVGSPALLSAGNLMSRVAFGVALPVIFISGSINTVVAGRVIHGRIFKNSQIRFINTKMGWITWLAIITIATVIAFIIAEVIPFFNDLLSISSSLFISGFTFYFPALMWFMLIREGPWTSPRNMALGALNFTCLLIGLLVLVAGTYSSVKDIIDKYNAGAVRGVFTCSKPS
ncbi:putative amino acid transporter [Aspergillus lucknowensis]|uniref:Transmembrane amino acid transporter protein-domain-containing protein n=1 Tax=Aspergillus lucknowensis TaxID=176173 RepID=A0ABR4L8V8_9EURO